MVDSSTTIRRKDRLAARGFQVVYPVIQRAFYRSPELEFATKDIAPPTTIQVPTRHGPVSALVFAPTAADLADQQAAGHRPPVHVLTHGGAFILQYPQEEGNVARYLASEVGAFVVVPDYTAAPQAQFPVAEDQNYDVFDWVHQATEQPWDTERVSVGGPSAGGKYALSVALDAIDAGAYAPVAVSTEYGVADLSRPDSARTSTKKRPTVSPALMRLVRGTYYQGADFNDPRVSPLLHPRLGELPPTLVMTAELDTLKHESNELAEKLRDLGVQVTHHEFPGVDHGFTHQKPVDVAQGAITMLGDHLRAAYDAAL